MSLVEWIITLTVFQVLLTCNTCKASCSTDLDLLPAVKALSLQENSLSGTLILNVTAENSLLMVNPHPYIKVENGSLYTSIDLKLDGDTNKATCKTVTQDQTSIILKCPSSSPSSTQFIIVFNYTDDFDPTLPESLSQGLHVKERSSPGTLIVDLLDNKYSASDQDCDTTNFIYVVQTDVFKVTPNGKGIVVVQELDYERQSEYTFNLTVRSSVNNQGYRSASTQITIYVDDVDDEKPVFDFSVFTLTVPERTDLSNQSFEATPAIHAHDGDLGVNATIVYSIDSIPSGLNITIDNVTAKVNILTKLDYEVQSEYLVNIRATQVDNDLMTTSAVLKIKVEDINDNWPKFINQVKDITISEMTEENTFLVLMNARDEDQGENAKFNYTITSDDLSAFGLKYDNITSQVWLIVVDSSALRGKVEGHVKVHLQEKDEAMGSPCANRSECSTEITVHILDYNDNTPVFSKPSYDFTIFSHSHENSPMGKIEASDRDRGDNARLTYSLSFIPSTTDCSKVIINETSGAITLSKPMPINSTCYLLATACDNPLDVLSKRCATVSVTVKVIEGSTGGNGSVEVHDITIPENIPVGTLVTILPITGLITNSTDFRIDHNSIFTNTNIDKEKQDNYRLVFVNGEHLDSLILNIHVDDVNDNPPVFTSHSYNLHVLDDAQIGQTVLQVNATDADVKNNAALNFSIFGGSPWFSINPDSGSVQLVKLWPSSSEMIILVHDKGIPSLQDMAIVKISGPSPNQTAVVILPVTADSLNSDLKVVSNKLSSILGVDVRIHNIDSLSDVPELGSRVQISARRDKGEQLEADQINSLLKDHAKEIYSRFKEDAKSADILTAPFIAVLVISIVLLLVLISSCIMLKKQRTKYKRTNRLFEKLNRDTTIYDAAHNKTTSVSAESNGSVTIAALQNGSLPVSHSLASNVFENPAYRHDDSLDSGSNNENAPPQGGDASSHEGDTSLQDGNSSLHDDDSHSVEAPQSDYVDIPIPNNSRVDFEDENDKETKRDSPRTSRASSHYGSSLISEVQRVTEPVHKTMINVKLPPASSSDAGHLDAMRSSEPVNNSKYSNQIDRRNSEADSGLPGDITYDQDAEDGEDNQHTSKTHLDALDSRIDPLKHDSAVDLNKDMYDSAPEEPEPDYAKKVRFNEHSSATFKTNDGAVDRFDEELSVTDTNIADPFYFGENEMTAL